METENLLEPFINKAETFSKTTLELLKLQSLDKTAELASVLASRLLLLVVLSLFTLTFTITVALWLGDMLEKNYYGFLIVSGFYLMSGLLLILLHPRIKARLNNMLVLQMFR